MRRCPYLETPDIYGFILSGCFDRQSILSRHKARLLLCNLTWFPPHKVLTMGKCEWMSTTRWNHDPIMTLSTLMALCKGNLPVTDGFSSQYKKCWDLMFILILFWISCRISSQISDYWSRHDSFDIIVSYFCSTNREYRNAAFHIWSFICQIIAWYVHCVFAAWESIAEWTSYVQSILHNDVFIHQLYQV